MVRKAKGGAAVLQAIPDNEQMPATKDAQGVLDVIQLINNIESQMEERIATIMSAAEDAIVSLKNDLKTKIVRLPKATRDMPLKQFQEKYPDDFKTGALQEIRQRYAAMAEAAQQAIPSTAAKGTKVGMKRAAAEPITVLKTVKTRRTASALMPSWGAGAPAAAAAAAPIAAAAAPAPRRAARAGPMDFTIAEEDEEEHPAPGPSSARDNQLLAGNIPSKQAFNGLPLQTPLPFAGSAMPLPVTMLTQKRGGRTKAVAAPDAAVVTTADGMQWALGKDGMAAIPESHRAEVAEMLSAQFNFLAAALGKTVFDRPGGRGSKR